ncbi:formylglycine-generating enzyme family protein [Hymenobacter cheonanensis]|uniref:formylglycine-generating enzyme family protein n=1 Tax=Hymenobacter sp. CA2-7 TaxID=3063993 RepID=UPI002713E70A|nr:SUMF1/EgtB/PvdO family nonheme iron enzyme [Hymenobacter sp. CA2-7]MDO7886695.1 SUMF1/EgtB/PvdO family nonheme iron enzyme [Hymenobacter sp. CA2-7]
MLLGGLLPRTGRAQSDYQKLARLVSPPGTVPIGDSLWLDETEITNIHWAEYLHFLQKDSSAALYRSQQPNPADVQYCMKPNWDGDEFSMAALRSTYPSVTYLPIVGITYAQAIHYCQWRTAAVNRILHSEDYLSKHARLRNYDFRVVYRLPTIQEWELAAAGGLDLAKHPLGVVHPAVHGSRQYREQLCKPKEAAACLAAAKLPGQQASAILRMEFTVQENVYFEATGQPFFCPGQWWNTGNPKQLIPDFVFEHSPNKYGLFNMIGNVAELTAKRGIAKGGSFKQSIKECAVQANFSYTQPQPWLGFRCACTVHITPKP